LRNSSQGDGLEVRLNDPSKGGRSVNSHRTRLRALAGAALLALCLMAVGAAGAEAAKVKITGGTTTITPSAATTQFLTTNGIGVAPLAPATLSNGVVTLPIARGRIDLATLRGFVAHRGGLKFTKGNRSLALRHFLITSTRRGAFLDATTPVRRCRAVSRARRARARGRVCSTRVVGVRIARLSNVVRNSDNSVTADLLLSQRAARLINKLAGSHVVSAGANLGTARIVATTA
jgi:hypothetical protein